jgi:hypothetical protein
MSSVVTVFEQDRLQMDMGDQFYAGVVLGVFYNPSVTLLGKSRQIENLNYNL